MADLMDSLYFEEGFTIRLNSDSDPLFLLVDYSSRSYPMNMANQHYHDFYEIFITLEDDAAHLVNGRYVQLHKGDILFLRPQMLHMSIYPRRATAQRRIIINYNHEDTLAGLDYQVEKIRSLFSHDVPVLRLPPKFLTKVIARLNELFLAGKAKESGWQLEVYSRFILFLLEIVRSMRHSTYSEENHPGLPDLKMYAITEYIDTHYMEAITLRDIAERFAISPFYLSHQFTKVMGTSFVTYVQKVRIRYALQMLSYTGARIHDIIADCGFASSSQFNRTFSSFCNMSPSDFRKLSSADRDIIISSLDPERSEVVPAAFPPRFKTLPRKRRGIDGMKLGILADILFPADPQALKEQLSVLGVETVCIDIPLCFPSIASYSTLSDRKLLELADLGFDISFIIVRSRILASDDEGARAAAVSECIAALKAAEVLSAPFLGILPEDGNPDQLIKSLSMIIEEAGKHGVAVAIRPEVGSAVDGFKGAVNFAEKLDKLSILLDPLALLHDDRENTFSFFEEVFSVLGSRIAALMLCDRLDGRSVNIGKGIMAKTYPRIAALLPHSMPLIRAGAEPATVADDIMYIRRVFF